MFTTRITWPDLPDPIRARIEGLLGGRVVEHAGQTGGFSPGVADRLLLDDGRRAFVKAVHPEMNEGSAALYRREAHVNALLPEGVPAPKMRHTFDDDGWVVLVFDDVDGHQPVLPWREDEFAEALDAFDQLGRVGAGCTADLPRADLLLADDYAGFGRLMVDQTGDVDPWLREHLPELHELAQRALPTIGGDTLCLVDGRADNMLVSGDRVWLLDWPWAALGSPWFDVSMLTVTAVFQGTTFDVMAAADAWVSAHGGTPGNLTGVLLGMLAFTADAARRPADPSLPALREYHKRSVAAAVPVLRQRVEAGLVPV